MGEQTKTVSIQLPEIKVTGRDRRPAWKKMYSALGNTRTSFDGNSIIEKGANRLGTTILQGLGAMGKVLNVMLEMHRMLKDRNSSMKLLNRLLEKQ